jgi:hypothetical protein
VPRAFEFAESFPKLAGLPLAGFKIWWALYCLLFKRELFIGNLIAGLQNQQDCLLPVFKSSRCNSKTSVIE